MSDKPRGELTIRTLAMPANTNPAGDIFGGWVVSQMDIAGGICSSERAQCRTVTVALDRMHFIRPVKTGDVLCVYTEVERVGSVEERGGRGKDPARKECESFHECGWS